MKECLDESRLLQATLEASDADERKRLVDGFLDELVRRAAADAQAALAGNGRPPPDDGWTRLESVVLPNALNITVDLLPSRRENVAAVERYHDRLRDELMAARGGASEAHQREFRARFEANEFCFMTNRKRPTAEELVREFSKENIP